ncbi:MAG TPA: rhodanese-like domain-containing protein [Bacteriovoracaceae bacterium]|nr:rhodanese-like domain-containing protein [Bacteriovoracaceae bacterium]
MKKLLLSLLVFNFLFLGLAQADVRFYEEVRADKAILLDIREADEIKSGMIKGASWLPLSSLNKNPVETIRKLRNIVKNKDLYIYCRSGRRAEAFISQVQNDGIKGINVGGYEDLVSQGLPFETR